MSKIMLGVRLLIKGVNPQNQPTFQDVRRALWSGGTLKIVCDVPLSYTTQMEIKMEAEILLQNELVFAKYWRSRNPNGTRESFDILLTENNCCIEAFFVDEEMTGWRLARIPIRSISRNQLSYAMEILRILRDASMQKV